MSSCDEAPGGNALCALLTLRRQAWLTLLFWQVGIALLLWGFTAFLHRTKDSWFFDQAGRQRLLAQQLRDNLQMVKEGHREDRARLLAQAELFEQGLRSLERNTAGRDFRLTPVEPQVRLSELRTLWRSYHPRLERFARLPRQAGGFAAAYDEALAMVPRLVESADAFMKASVRRDQLEVRRFRRLIITLGAVNLLLSLLGLWAAHRCFLQPMEALQDAIIKFKKGNFSARVEAASRGEMLSLISAFNSMALSVEQNSHQLRDILDKSPAVVFIKDLEGRYLFANRRYEALFHQAPGTMEGKTDFDVFPAKSAESFRAVDREILRSETIRTLEEEVPQDDGPHRYLTIKFPLRDPSGKTYGLCGIATDITDYKRTEEKFRQSQKMEAVGRLAGGVAHDFNNILTAVLGYCDLLQDQVASDSARKDLGEIREAAERASALTRQLLALSRKQASSPGVLDLNAVVSGMERLLTRTLGENVSLNCRLAAGLGRVRADKGGIEQILLNLAVNARDAMPNGGRLTIETAARPGSPPYTELSVTDTGTGMDEATVQRVFEPFFTTKEPGRGTGLGLSIVHDIVQENKGRIDLHSRPGQGTTFKVSLPVVTESSPEPPREDGPAPAARGAGEVILLIDRDEPVRHLAARLLSQAGYAVFEAGDPEKALALARSTKARVRLLVTSERPREVDPGLKVLYLLENADEAAARSGATHTPAHFLAKPFTTDGLLAAVRRTLDA